MKNEIAELLRLVVRDYPFTLAIGAIVLLVSVPYNLIVPPEQFCGNWAPWVGSYMHLTSPFNIGCEASLMDLWMPDGALRFVGNFSIMLLQVSLVEFVLKPIDRKLKRNVMVAAIMAAYLLELCTLSFFKTLSVGTSIIGISMMVTLICWMIYKGWKARGSPIKVALCCIGAVWLACITFIDYSAQNPFGHGAGALFFLLFMAMFIACPNWWEEWLLTLKLIYGKLRSALS